MRLGAIAVGLLAAGVLAFCVNFVGATGGHCDDSCSGNFPYWLYAGSGWVALLCAVLLVGVGLAALLRRLTRS
jgi:hypothetical protein